MSNPFSTLGLSPELADLLKQNGITEPTPVQRQSIPLLLEGKDIIAQAQTGTGKTLAFALPMLQKINTDKEQVQALVLTPTRELAIQITAELKKLAPSRGATVLAAYGGQDVDAQIRKLRHAPHIVVATPGRLIDHMTRQTINLGKLSMLVLDEADQMLHMGFLPEVESIITQTPRSRQTMLFSATIPDPIRQLAGEYMNQPVDIQIASANVTLDSIVQLVIDTNDRGKQRSLLQLLEQHRPYLAVVFCRTKIRAKKLNEALQDNGISSDELHGDLTQAKREQVMKRFREARLQVLVATDVAARGLDIEGVTHVYNYDCPADAELYIHRIGRTGRAGQAGVAVTLATPYDQSNLDAIEKGISAKLPHRTLAPDGELLRASRSGKAQEGQRRGGDSSGRSNYGRNKAGGTRSKPAAADRSGSGAAERGKSRRADKPGGNAGQASSKRGGKGGASGSENPWEISPADLAFASRGKTKDKPASQRSASRDSAQRKTGKPGSPGRSGGGRSRGR